MNELTGSQLRNRLLTLGLLATLPRLAQGGDAINPAEAQKIIEGIARRQSQGDNQAALVELLGVDRELWKRLSEEINGASCAALLSAQACQAGKGSAARLALGLVLSADSMAQDLARQQFIDGKPLTPEQLVAAQTALGAKVRVQTPELGFKDKDGIFFAAPVAHTLDTIEVYSLYEMQMRELAVRGHVKAADAKVQVTSFNHYGDTLTFSFTITRPGKSALKLNIKNWQLEEGQTKEEALASTLVAALQHAELLDQPERILQEVNMLRYDLLKLYRVAQASVKEDLADAIFLLKDGSAQGMFESNAGYRGRMLKILLEAKVAVLDIAQIVQAEAAAGVSSEIRTAAEIALQNTAKKGKRGRKKGKVAATAAAPAVKVAYVERPNSTKPLYRQSAQSGYYYPTQYTDSNNLSTMAWFMDPNFMFTHPWYWGASDNSFLSHLMLYEMLSQRQAESHRYFMDTQPYDPSRFSTPLEPRLYNSDERPFAEAWDYSAPATDTLSGPEMLGWNALTGPSANEDFAPTPDVSTSASSSGWFSSSGSSSSSSESSSTTTTGLFDMTTTGSSTTGIFDMTTTGSTTTTTGTDWTTTTTTTGSDWTTTTTGSYDSTTTGSVDTTTTGSGSDW